MSWQFVSFFGDSTVLLPSAAALLIVLFLRAPSRQVACQWALLFGITGAIVSASKLAFMGWGIGIREIDFTGFSGHTALSAAFWPIFLWLLLSRRTTTGTRRAAIVVGYALAALVGYSTLTPPRKWSPACCWGRVAARYSSCCNRGQREQAMYSFHGAGYSA